MRFEVVGTLVVVGCLVFMGLRHAVAAFHGASLRPAALAAGGLAFAAVRGLHFADPDPEVGLWMLRLEYATAVALPGAALVAIEGLAGRPTSRDTWVILASAVPLQVACLATDWLIGGPPIEKWNLLGHRYIGGTPAPALLVLVPFFGYGVAMIRRRIGDLPPRHARQLRIAMAVLVAFGAHDILMGTNVFRSIHLFEYGFLVAGVIVAGFEQRRDAQLREERDQAIARNHELRLQFQSVDRLASLGMLAAGTAHEINNPLSYVLANAEMLEEELAGNTFTRLLASEIVSGSQRIRRVVQDLSKLSRDQPVTETATVDVHKVLRGCLAMIAPQMRHRGCVVEELGEVPPVFVVETKLFQVFLNLLVNACQAIPDGHASANEVRVRTRSDGADVVVEIEDTGTGMTPEVQARIFEPFFTTKEVGQGTGLGLAITRDLVAAMGGAIAVASAPGAGTRFTLRLPAAADRSNGATTAPPAAVAAAPRRRSVLIVDDERTIADGMARLLADHEVDVAFSGRDALVRIADKRYDVILCDVMMPEVGGIQLYQELERRSDPVRTRMVFMTGGVLSSDAEEFLRTTRWVPKPIRSVDLRRIIAEVE